MEEEQKEQKEKLNSMQEEERKKEEKRLEEERKKRAEELKKEREERQRKEREEKANRLKRLNTMGGIYLEEAARCLFCSKEFETGEAIAKLGCNSEHVFHSDCVEKELESKRKAVVPAKCPICGKKIEEGKIKRHRVEINTKGLVFQEASKCGIC